MIWSQVWRVPWLVIHLFWEILKANIQVVKLLFVSNESLRPALLEVPLRLTAPSGILVYSSMITLTPGTLSLEVSADQRFLYVHVIHTTDPGDVVRGLAATFEDPLLKVFR
jgi:multisubunit Na+/H+ antiporter MnhE subunit